MFLVPPIFFLFWDWFRGSAGATFWTFFWERWQFIGIESIFCEIAGDALGEGDGPPIGPSTFGQKIGLQWASPSGQKWAQNV